MQSFTAAFLSAILFTLSVGQTAWAKPANIEIIYLETTSDAEKRALNTIRESGANETLKSLSKDFFPFKQGLAVIYGGEDGPLYDPAEHAIYIPYTFFNEALRYFTINDYEKRYGKSALLGAKDTLLHTLLHEAAHAYIEDQKIPILGKEEDAADNFANILLIEYVEDGDDIAISAADMFAMESEDRPDYYDFGEYIDEHSFDLQRYFSILCLVYGSYPKKHAGLLDELEKEYQKDRKEFCTDNYPFVSESWHRYFKSGS